MIDLEELAQLINKKWPESEARVRSAGEVLFILGPTNGSEFWPAMEDFHSARWIIWAWDQLRFLYLDAGVSIWDKENTGVWSVEVYDEVDMVFSVEAPTRAEALARALLEALREEK